MKLSQEEEDFIARLRASDRLWQTTRWIVWLTGMLLMTSPVPYFLLALNHREPDLPSSTLAILLLIGLALSSYARINWRGNPKRRLLIKLIDHARSGPAGDTEPGALL